MQNQIKAQKQVSYLYHLQAFTKQRPWVYNMKASWFPTMVWSMAWILLGALFLFLLNNPRWESLNYFQFPIVIGLDRPQQLSYPSKEVYAFLPHLPRFTPSEDQEIYRWMPTVERLPPIFPVRLVSRSLSTGVTNG